MTAPDKAELAPPVPDPTTRSPSGAGNEDFANAGVAEDPRRDVHSDPADVGIQQFALTGVDGSTNLDA